MEVTWSSVNHRDCWRLPLNASDVPLLSSATPHSTVGHPMVCRAIDALSSFLLPYAHIIEGPSDPLTEPSDHTR